MPGTLTYPMYARVQTTTTSSTTQQSQRDRSNSLDYLRPPPQRYATVRPSRVSLPSGPGPYIVRILIIEK